MVVCGGVWWFAVVCGGLRWFVVDCGGLSFSHTLDKVSSEVAKSIWHVVETAINCSRKKNFSPTKLSMQSPIKHLHPLSLLASPTL